MAKVRRATATERRRSHRSLRGQAPRKGFLDNPGETLSVFVNPQEESRGGKAEFLLLGTGGQIIQRTGSAGREEVVDELLPGGLQREGRDAVAEGRQAGPGTSDCLQWALMLATHALS